MTIMTIGKSVRNWLCVAKKQTRDWLWRNYAACHNWMFTQRLACRSMGGGYHYKIKGRINATLYRLNSRKVRKLHAHYASEAGQYSSRTKMVNGCWILNRRYLRRHYLLQINCATCPVYVCFSETNLRRIIQMLMPFPDKPISELAVMFVVVGDARYRYDPPIAAAIGNSIQLNIPFEIARMLYT